MQHLIGDLFNSDTYRWPITGHHAGFIPDAICITTNGFVKKNGEAVMGRGCAKRVAELRPELPQLLGNDIRTYGNRVHTHGFTSGPLSGLTLVMFPVKCERFKSRPATKLENFVVGRMVKRFKPGDMIPGWACKADLLIIERSADQLVNLADERNWSKVVLPRPGCGCGELSWQNEVKPLLEGILDDRFYSITFK